MNALQVLGTLVDETHLMSECPLRFRKKVHSPADAVRRVLTAVAADVHDAKGTRPCRSQCFCESH